MRLVGAFDVGRPRRLTSLLHCCCCWLLVSAQSQKPRYLVYPPPAGAATKLQLIFGLGIPMDVDVSTIIGYVMKCNYNLPYNASYLSELRYERSYAEKASLGSEHDSSRWFAEQENSGIERAHVYRMIEVAISSGSQLEGKPCLLRVICEAAATPFSTRHSVFSQMLHTFLTPSTTRERIDQQYLAAERMGVQAGSRQCKRAFPECRANFLEYFSEIH